MPSIQTLIDHVHQRQDRLIEITRRLIGMDSQNTPPFGLEQECQNWIAETLARSGYEPQLYDLQSVPGLEQHPIFHPGRDYRNRPNLVAKRGGSGGGRSLLLSGHIDTVPKGTQNWTRDPFGGEIEGDRLYGRGSNDMKGGIATNLFVMECVAELGLSLTGELIFESVVDEEFGGSNGTLAGRLRGDNADAAILSEPSFLRVCPAQRGGRTVHITFHAKGGVLQGGGFPQGTIPQLTHFLSSVKDFAAQRNRILPHELYAESGDHVPVSVTKVITAPWGYSEPITIPETAQVELYWQLMPGETQADVEAEFFSWFRELVESAPEIYPSLPRVEMPIRWMPGSFTPPATAIVQRMAAAAETVLGAKPIIAGIEGPCDLFILQDVFHIPAVIWGAKGGNTHGADEYVEINSLVKAAQALLVLVADWCGEPQAAK